MSKTADAFMEWQDGVATPEQLNLPENGQWKAFEEYTVEQLVLKQPALKTAKSPDDVLMLVGEVMSVLCGVVDPATQCRVADRVRLRRVK